MPPTSNVVSIASVDRRRILAERDQLVEENFPLVRQIAATLAQKLPEGFEVDELAGAGALGLLRAATVYRAHPGVPFGVYARKVITGFMLDSIRRRNYLAVTMAVPANAERFLAPVIPIDEELDRERVAAAVEELPENLRGVIHLCYRDGKSVRQAAKVLGVSQQRAEHLRSRAVRILQLKFLVS